MRPKYIRREKKGELLTRKKWNDVVDAVNRAQINLGQSTGLEGQVTPFGTILRVPTAGVVAYLAIANGNIPARSGSAAGIGTVHIVSTSPTYSGGALTAVALSTSSIDYKVYNPSSTTMASGNGIDSGQYCWIQQDQNGLWCVTPLECS